MAVRLPWYCALLCGLLVLGPGTSARAQTAPDGQDCTTTAAPERTIAACTNILQRGDSESAANHALAFTNRGIAHYNRRDFVRALADYDQATRFNPQLTYSFANRGLARENLRDFAGARSDFEAALRIAPGDRIATDGLQRLRLPRQP